MQQIDFYARVKLRVPWIPWPMLVKGINYKHSQFKTSSFSNIMISKHHDFSNIMISKHHDFSNNTTQSMGLRNDYKVFSFFYE